MRYLSKNTVIYLLCLHGTAAIGVLTVTYKQFSWID